MLSIVEQFSWDTGHPEVPAMRFSPASPTERQIPRNSEGVTLPHGFSSLDAPVIHNTLPAPLCR